MPTNSRVSQLYDIMGERVQAVVEADFDQIVTLCLNTASELPPPEFEALVALAKRAYLECMITQCAGRHMHRHGSADTISTLNLVIGNVRELANKVEPRTEPVAANAPRADSPWSQPR